jgi:hypothetical protein
MIVAMTRLGDSAVGYAALIVLLVVMTFVASVRLIAASKMLTQYIARGEQGRTKREEMQT